MTTAQQFILDALAAVYAEQEGLEIIKEKDQKGGQNESIQRVRQNNAV